MTTDQRGLVLSGADAEQGAAFDAVVRDYFEYRLSAFPALKTLCAGAPDFAMAHLLKGFLLLAMGTRGTINAAQNCALHVAGFGAELTERERLHLHALQSWSRGDTTSACRHWDAVLAAEPLDLLALKLQHFALFWRGEFRRMRNITAQVLPAWDDGISGYGGVLGVYAFALEETGDYAAAEKFGREAVARDGEDLWAVHAVAHVLDAQGRLAEGAAWLARPLDAWHDRNPFQSHLWWHAAMFAFEAGDYARVLDLYDRAVRPTESDFYLDLQNTISLLARLEFAGVSVGERWDELADICEARHDDHILMFTEPHLAIALSRTERHAEAARHLQSLREVADGSAAELIAPIVAPLCEAIGDFYRGDFTAAARRLSALSDHLQPIGGSQTQRDLFAQYQIQAAIHAGNRTAARELLVARIATRPNSYPTWQSYAELCDNKKTATKAEAKCQKIADEFASAGVA